ncbi:MAG: ribonuclease III [bacterium]
MNDHKKLEKRINCEFKNKDFLKQALVHRSYLNENPGFKLGHNERLEFLGDAVLEIVVTEFLYNKFPDTPEGNLTDLRASLVNAKMLSEVAVDIDLEENILMSRGEARDVNSKARQYILANAVEALIGAIYLDQGIEKSGEFIKQEILKHLDNIVENNLYKDPKSTFQEKAQDKINITPHYQVLSETGPDHDKNFEVGAYLENEQVAKGKGSSKHEAEVDAAQKALNAKGW